jgi:hypothetical protein
VKAFAGIAGTVAVVLIACAVLTQGSVAEPPAAATTVETTVETPAEAQAVSLDQLDLAFRAAYAEHRAAVLSAAGPVIIVSGDDLVLLNAGRRSQVRFSPAIYHTLKSYSHAPLALHVMLVGRTDQPLDDTTVEQLRNFQRLLIAARKQIDELELSDEERCAQRSLCDESLGLLDGVLAERRITASKLEVFTRHIGPALLANSARAARVQLDALDHQVQSWRKELAPHAWSRLRVIVEGSHTVRQGNLAVQYFNRLLTAKASEHRIVFTEGIYEEPRALQVLGTVIVDTRIGASFFGDPQRMHRDLLADAAAEYLKSWPANR